MPSESLNGQQPEEKKSRLQIKVSRSLAEELKQAYEEQLAGENPPFKEAFLGSYFEDCVALAANSVVGEEDAKKEVEAISSQLREQHDQDRQLKTLLYILTGIALLASLVAIIYYRRYKAHAL